MDMLALYVVLTDRPPSGKELSTRFTVRVLGNLSICDFSYFPLVF